MNYDVSYKCEYCRAEMYLQWEQLAVKRFCSVRCWVSSQKRPYTKCGLCRIEFPKKKHHTFCSDQCALWKEILSKEMIHISLKPTPVKWQEFYERNYFGEMKEFVW